MIDSSPIRDELWAKIPPNARAAISEVLRALQERVD
jgi:hypothetical protein